MKKLIVSLCVLLSGPAFAATVQKSTHITVVGHDSYGGITNVNCTNPNGTLYFGLVTMNNHKTLCDPAGHPYFGRGFFVFNIDTYGNDESGGNYSTFSGAKYGSTNLEYIWDTQEVARLKAWDFNLIGPYNSAYATSFWPWYTGGTNPNKVPMLTGEEVCSYSWYNASNYAPAPIKDNLSVTSPNFNLGYYGYDGVTDYEDPNWVTYVNGFISNTKNDPAFLLTANAVDKSYSVGFVGCDSDGLHGFNAGPDFGSGDFRLSLMVAEESPVEWASVHQHQIYTDPNVYNKKTWYTQLTGKYASISALNTAWGSNYTTFGTSGTCYGSGFPTWVCASSSAASSIGVGNGTNLTFSATLNTTVSPNSLGIFVNGTLVGGDGGNGHFSGTAGTVYGPNLSGTINYSTGALSITFTSGNAPASGLSVTAQYITNGWCEGGTGVMDECGATNHQAWTGTNLFCIDGVGSSQSCTGGPYTSAGMVTDLNVLDTTLAARYASTLKNTINTYFPGGLFFGSDVTGSSNMPPNRYVIMGMAPYLDGALVAGSAVGYSQAKLDFWHTYAGDIALAYTNYATANADSPFAWPNTPCTHSGTTVTCTLQTPQDFSTSSLIQESCTDTTYQGNDIHPSSVGTNTITYTASQTPVTSSTICNVSFYDGDYVTQSARANTVASTIESLPNQKYTADGVYPWVMDIWWQWQDTPREGLDWGIVDTRDNAYDGIETTTAVIPCQPPEQAYNCGGELRSGWGTDDGLTPLINANKAVDYALTNY